MENIRAYIPDSLWYDYETVRFAFPVDQKLFPAQPACHPALNSLSSIILPDWMFVKLQQCRHFNVNAMLANKAHFKIDGLQESLPIKAFTWKCKWLVFFLKGEGSPETPIQTSIVNLWGISFV